MIDSNDVQGFLRAEKNISFLENTLNLVRDRIVELGGTPKVPAVTFAKGVPAAVPKAAATAAPAAATAPATAPPIEVPKPKKTEDELYAMTVADLREFAIESGINLHGATSKDDIVKAIKKAK